MGRGSKSELRASEEDALSTPSAPSGFNALHGEINLELSFKGDTFKSGLTMAFRACNVRTGLVSQHHF